MTRKKLSILVIAAVVVAFVGGCEERDRTRIVKVRSEAAGDDAETNKKGASNAAGTDTKSQQETESVFVGAGRLADKVEKVIEAYAFDGDVDKALGDWKQGEDPEQMSTDRIQFGNGVKSRGIESFKVVAVTIQVGYLGGHMKNHVLEASILTAGKEPKIANAFRLDEGSRLEPMPLFPDNAPHIERLATDVKSTLADSERCTSLPIASADEIKAQLPETGAQSSALEGEGEVQGRLDEFCDRIKAWDGGFEFGVRSMLVVGRDKKGEYTAQIAFAPGVNDEDHFAIITWPDRLHDRR